MFINLFKIEKNGICFAAKITPNAKKNQIDELCLDEKGRHYLKILVTAIAADGKANTALIDLLTNQWQLKKSQVQIKKGTTHRYKLIHISGDPKSLIAYLGKYI